MDKRLRKSSQRKDIHLPKMIDSEWLQLLLEAKELGISKEDIRIFLKKQKLINKSQKL